MWWPMIRSHRAKRKTTLARYILILVRMMMRCLRNSGFYRRATYGRGSLGNARCNVTRGRAIIRDQGSKICEGIDKQYFVVAYFQWQMFGGVGGDSHEFGHENIDLNIFSKLRQVK